MADEAPPPFGLSHRLKALEARLRCPECGKGRVVHVAGAGLSCSACGARFGIRAGVPLLLSERSRRELRSDLQTATGVQMVAEYQAVEPSPGKPRPTSGWRRLLRPPDVMYHTNPGMRRGAARRIFDHRGPGTLILNVGGGPTRYSAEEITLNLEPFHNVDVVGDAHELPFLDDTFDSVVCNAVLEHVGQPERVVAEMLRVLRPGGLLYAEVPFIFFFHGYPSDYRRYTREGVRRMFAGLAEPEIGVAIGPVSALLQSANMVVAMLVPNRPAPLRRIVNGGFRCLTFAFKYLDKLLVRHERAHLVAGGFWVLGRKPDPEPEVVPGPATSTR
ncbi:MAG: class I SAM-dependent methyltransferase [Planctomycetes bacterium]|nr:class I SAM-dependent methyltransferase [Planctomycetota bacterium]